MWITPEMVTLKFQIAVPGNSSEETRGGVGRRCQEGMVFESYRPVVEFQLSHLLAV